MVMRNEIGAFALCASLAIGVLAGGCNLVLGITDLGSSNLGAGGEDGGAGHGGASSSASGTSSGGGNGGSGGMVDNCPAGTANCDQNPDCETNTVDNPMHCGGCNKACSAEGYCRTNACAEPEIVAQGALVASTQDLAVTNDYVIWTSNAAKAVARVVKSGGTPETIAAGNECLRLAVTPDGSRVFWESTSDNSIRTALVNGPLGGPGDVFEVTSIWGLATDGVKVYWGTSAQEIYAKPIVGGTATLVTTDSGSLIGTIAVDDAFVYWTSPGQSAVRRAPKAGGAPGDISKTEAGPWGILADPTGVYWMSSHVNPPGHEVRAWHFAASPIDLATGPNALGFGEIAMNSTKIFWPAPEIMQVDKAGGPSFRLSTLKGLALTVAADEEYVYWIDNPSNNLMRIRAR